MKTVAVVYHSEGWRTKSVASSIAKGLKRSGVGVEVFSVKDIEDTAVLNGFGGIVFGCPTYMGIASAEFKKFMDKSSKQWLTQAWKNKAADGFTNSQSLSGDKLNTLVQLSVFAAQHGMVWIGQGEANSSDPDHPGKPDSINRAGSTLGLMTQSGHTVPLESSLAKEDQKTAQIFGKRIAELVLRI